MSDRKRGAQHRNKPRAIAKLEAEEIWQRQKDDDVRLMEQFGEDSRQNLMSGILAGMAGKLNQVAFTLGEIGAKRNQESFIKAFTALVHSGLHLNDGKLEKLMSELAVEGRYDDMTHLINRALVLFAEGLSERAAAEALARDFFFNHASFDAAKQAARKFLRTSPYQPLQLLRRISLKERRKYLKLARASLGIESEQNLDEKQADEIIEKLLMTYHKVDREGLRQLYANTFNDYREKDTTTELGVIVNLHSR